MERNTSKEDVAEITGLKEKRFRKQATFSETGNWKKNKTQSREVQIIMKEYKEIQVALLGLGTVGLGVYKVLQRCQDDYEEMLTLLLRHLLIIFHRELTRKHVLKNEYLDHEMDTAASYFNENYNRDINIEEYAISRGMSVSWFIRNFKKSTGTTPMQFITSIRITNAQMLLETTNYAVNEIARIVGYDNPLYFSRLFHKQKGCSPSEYRKLLK